LDTPSPSSYYQDFELVDDAHDSGKWFGGSPLTLAAVLVLIGVSIMSLVGASILVVRRRTGAVIGVAAQPLGSQAQE
jgi:hypothetical protein